MESQVQLTVTIAYGDDPKVMHQETLQYNFEMLSDSTWLQSFVKHMENDDDNTEPKSRIIT